MTGPARTRYGALTASARLLVCLNAAGNLVAALGSPGGSRTRCDRPR